MLQTQKWITKVQVQIEHHIKKLFKYLLDITFCVSDVAPYIVSFLPLSYFFSIFPRFHKCLLYSLCIYNCVNGK